jgi:hypothetical protein
MKYLSQAFDGAVVGILAVAALGPGWQSLAALIGWALVSAALEAVAALKTA